MSVLFLINQENCKGIWSGLRCVVSLFANQHVEFADANITQKHLRCVFAEG